MNHSPMFPCPCCKGYFVVLHFFLFFKITTNDQGYWHLDIIQPMNIMCVSSMAVVVINLFVVSFSTVSVSFSIVRLLTTCYISCGSKVFNSEDKTSVVRKQYFYPFAGGKLIVSGHFLPNVVETFHRATG